MRLLLDTQVWLWSLVSPARIGSEAAALLEDSANSLLFSAASSWEIAIKYGLGRLSLPEPPADFILPRLTRDSIEPLPVHHRHVCAVAGLPNHHRDPFDRLLVAVAQVEDLPLVSADKQFLEYDIAVILA